MPNVVRPSTVIISNGASEGHLKITLELNINLNSNGIQASVTAAEAKEDVGHDKEFEFAIPEFESQNKVDFGKSVDNDRSVDG
jgi:hypothetical protein